MSSAAAPATPTVYAVASCRRPSPPFSNPTIVLISGSASRFHAFGSLAQTSLGSFSSWRGLKHLGISCRRDFRHKGRKEKCRGSRVYASLFGVGAPEALVIGVVALLVFGPKGLAEVARTLGKTLRAFQPTIRELQDVSREFKSTLEREIGLDEVTSTVNNTYKPTSQTPTIDPNGATTRDPIENLMKAVAEEQHAESAAAESQAVTSGSEASSEASAPTTTEAVSTPLVASEVSAAAEAPPQTPLVASEVSAAAEAPPQAPSLEKTEK